MTFFIETFKVVQKWEENIEKVKKMEEILKRKMRISEEKC